MNKLIMTVGLPRSGKSTWARSHGAPIVNPDSIRLALHGQPFIGSAEPMVWVIARYMVKALFLAGHKEVILDATNTTKARRNEWISRDWRRQFEYFMTPKEVCLSRTNDPELMSVIEKMAEKFEPLEEEEWHR